MMMISPVLIILFLSKNTHGGVVRRGATEACKTDGVVSGASCLCGIQTCEVGSSCEFALPFALATLHAQYQPSPYNSASNYGSVDNPYIYKNTPATCTPAACAHGCIPFCSGLWPVTVDGWLGGSSCMCGDTNCEAGSVCDLTSKVCTPECASDGVVADASCLCGNTICEVGSSCASKVCTPGCEPDGVAGTSCICGDTTCKDGQICDFTSTSCYKCYATSTGTLLANSGLECANGDFVDTWNGCIDRDSFRVRCPENYFPCNNKRENGEFKCREDCTDEGGLKDCYKACYASSTGIYLKNFGLECANGKFSKTWNGCIGQESLRVRCPEEFFPCNNLANNGKEFRCMRDCADFGGQKDCREGPLTIEECATNGVVAGASCLCGDTMCGVGSLCYLTSSNLTTTCTGQNSLK